MNTNPSKIIIPLCIIVVCVLAIQWALTQSPMQAGDLVRHKFSGEKGQVIRALMFNYKEVRFYHPSRGLYEQEVRGSEIEPWTDP